ncbi:hypothetical protein TNIN_366331 [Trichonephila inaurata madagascariensis]|uniref:Uncharacterized protein n=1 Tax=Trichonephila inaurata madagascariensis TaxID=2747483 RepID=A0A8X7CI49_9ARAC|nr:hypothetical protein TNIN_366331 [Trichonephila inaurata madagascariensis]
MSKQLSQQKQKPIPLPFSVPTVFPSAAFFAQVGNGKTIFPSIPRTVTSQVDNDDAQWRGCRATNRVPIYKSNLSATFWTSLIQLRHFLKQFPVALPSPSQHQMIPSPIKASTQ